MPQRVVRAVSTQLTYLTAVDWLEPALTLVVVIRSMLIIILLALNTIARHLPMIGRRLSNLFVYRFNSNIVLLLGN